MRKAVQSAAGVWSLGETVDLESRFKGLRYKSASGLRSYGRVKGVYSVSYAEEDGSRVYASQSVRREETEVTLTLYFFDPESRDTSGIESRRAAILAAGEAYAAFVAYVSGGMVVYWDTVRQVKELLYLQEAVSPSVDSVRGVIYLEAPFKFRNKHGRPFALDDVTIESELGVASP